jgi:H2-forming N5,N10-methylenetetrahydromethanopterin dehydrogenase-like enzyme
MANVKISMSIMSMNNQCQRSSCVMWLIERKQSINVKEKCLWQMSDKWREEREEKKNVSINSAENEKKYVNEIANENINIEENGFI